LEPSFLWPLPEKEENSDDDGEGKEAEDEAEEPGWEDQPVKEKLVTALTYLRSQHVYCLHCGCQVESLGVVILPTLRVSSIFFPGSTYFLWPSGV
jgi:hypothetical protein